MSNTCQESMETSSTRVPYLSSLGLMSSTGQREGEGRVLRSSNNKNEIKKKGVAPYLLKSMLITTWQHLRQTHDAKKKNAFKTNKKRTTPAGDISKVGRVLEQKYINYNFDQFGQDK